MFLTLPRPAGAGCPPGSPHGSGGSAEIGVSGRTDASKAQLGMGTLSLASHSTDWKSLTAKFGHQWGLGHRYTVLASTWRSCRVTWQNVDVEQGEKLDPSCNLPHQSHLIVNYNHHFGEKDSIFKTALSRYDFCALKSLCFKCTIL